MKRLNRPAIDAEELFKECVRGIWDVPVAEKFWNAMGAISPKLSQYEERAAKSELYLSDRCRRGEDGQFVVGDITKGELTALYEKQMVAKTGRVRSAYDKILISAPLGKCPYCGFGHASTLDHFLSKSRYPVFSVHPANLVPACKDCNTGKGAGVVEQGGQMLHPYFEDENIEGESWLFADVLPTIPAAIRYRVAPPVTWEQSLADRVSRHFNELGLARRFATQAASELVEVGDLLETLVSDDSRREHLRTVATVERAKRRNTWKAAMYEALATSEWYVSGGYRNPAVAPLNALLHQ